MNQRLRTLLVLATAPLSLTSLTACSGPSPAAVAHQGQAVDDGCTFLSTTTGSVTDPTGNVWTLAPSGGDMIVDENGAPAGFTANVQQLVLASGVISHENSSGQWYAWNGSEWNAEGDPTTACSTAGTSSGGMCGGSSSGTSGSSSGSSSGGASDDAGGGTTTGGPDLSGYHLSFDWEGNDFQWAAVPTTGSWCTTLSAYPGSQGLRYMSNGDQECFSDPGLSGANDNPFSVGGGALTITSYPDPSAVTLCNNTSLDAQGPAYLSGQMTTQGWFTQLHGYFEARIQSPEGIGMWPAFWMLTEDSYETGGWPPELDVLEAFGAPSTTGSYGVGGGSNQAHWAVHSQNTSQQGGAWVTMNADIYSGYHTYGALWDADVITYFYDGVNVAQIATPSDFTLPMYMIVNTAVGGWWPGFATGESGVMNVDYVRAFSSDPGVPTAVLEPVSAPDGAPLNLYGATHD